jgi:transposase
MAQPRREHHKLVHDLIAEGAGIRQIARHLGWGRHTVQRYARATTWQEMLVGQKPRPSSLDPFKPYLLRRISEGCRKATALHREIATQGFTITWSSRTPAGSEPFSTAARNWPPSLTSCAPSLTC